MAECKEGTTSRKSAHNKKKKLQTITRTPLLLIFGKEQRISKYSQLSAVTPSGPLSERIGKIQIPSSEVPSMVLRPFPHPARVCSMPLPSS